MKIGKNALQAVILVIALLQTPFSAGAENFSMHRMGEGAENWDDIYNGFLTAVQTSITALGNTFANWVTTVDTPVLINATPVFVNDHTFTLPGNYAGVLPGGKRLVVACGGVLLDNTVASATYVAPNTTVAVNLANLTSPIGAVSYYATRSGLYTVGAGDVVCSDYGAPSWVNLQAAVSLANASGDTLILTSGTWPVLDNLTITAPVRVQPGAVFAVVDTKILTFSGFLDAGTYQIFTLSGSGSVSLGAAITYSYPEWWGLTPITYQNLYRGLYITGALGAGPNNWRADVGQEVFGSINAGYSVFQGANPGSTSNETFWVFGAYDAAGIRRKTGSISSYWCNTNTTNGFAAMRLNATQMVAGVCTDYIGIRIFGGNRLTFFGNGDNDYPSSERVVLLRGRIESYDDGANLVGNIYLGPAFKNAAGTKGIFLGYNSAFAGGVICAVGGSSNLSFMIHDGSAWTQALLLSAGGMIPTPITRATASNNAFFIDESGNPCFKKSGTAHTLQFAD